MSVQSPLPILQVNFVQTSSAEYQKVVEYKPDPNRVGYIDSVRIMVSATTDISNAQLKVEVNGVTKVKDKRLVVATTILPFGRNLMFRGAVDKGLTIYIKSDGVDTLKVLGTITGVEVRG